MKSLILTAASAGMILAGLVVAVTTDPKTAGRGVALSLALCVTIAPAACMIGAVRELED